MASTQGIPVMMVGRSAENGKGVIALLQPDYDGKPILTHAQPSQRL